eukprot:6471263-Amphidinium_carterae.1
MWDQIPDSDSSSHTLVDSNSFHSSDAGHELSPQTLQRHILPAGTVRGEVSNSPVSGPSPSQGPSRSTDLSHTTPCRMPDIEAASAALPVSHIPQRDSTHSVSEHTSSGGASPYNRWNELSDGCTSAATSSRGGLQPAELEKYLVPSGTKRKRGALPSGGSSTPSSTSQSKPHPTSATVGLPGGMSEYGDDPIDDFSESSTTPAQIPTSRPEDDDPIESFDVMRDLNATPLDTLSGADHDWIHGLPSAFDNEPASLLAFSCASHAASAAAHVSQTAGAVEPLGVALPLFPEGVLIQEVLTATTSEDEAPLTTLLTTRPGGISYAPPVRFPSPSSPASAQGLSLLQLTTRWSRYNGVRVGEAKSPGPHVFLEQIPIYTKEGQKGILTTKWRPQQHHWMCQMSVGPRHTACHQFSQIIALQRWMTKHAADLAATTQAEIQTRLSRAANLASQDGQLDDTLPDSASLPSLAHAGPSVPDIGPTTPTTESSSHRVRRRYTSKKSQSLDTLPATEVASSGRAEPLRDNSQAASAAC